MKTIYKYPLALRDTQPISLPMAARPLALQMQDGVPCLWAEVDTESETQSVAVYRYATGDERFADPGSYLGTVQDSRGLVWHYYLQTRAPR